MANCYLNDRFCDIADAQVSVLDRGFLFGDGVYEVIPIYRRTPLGWRSHMQRLADSLAAIGLDFNIARLREPCAKLVASCPHADQSLYVQITRGAAAVRKHAPPDNITPTVFAFTMPRQPPATEQLQNGIACITRADFRWLRGFIKSTSLLAAVLLASEAKKATVEETILLRDGVVSEGFSSNVMVVRGEQVSTPIADRRILRGITYEAVLHCVAQAGFTVARRDIAEGELHTADEIWISSSTREVLPVVQLDGKPVGSGKPGAVFAKIYSEWQRYIAAQTASDSWE